MGSTSVPGPVAKPVIDLLAGVESLAKADELLHRLCENGCTASRELNATLDDRKWLMRWKNGHRTHYQHVVMHGGAPRRDRLGLRDALRRDRALARRYAEPKTTLAERHRSDREAYTEAMAASVRAVQEGRAFD